MQTLGIMIVLIETLYIPSDTVKKLSLGIILTFAHGVVNEICIVYKSTISIGS